MCEEDQCQPDKKANKMMNILLAGSSAMLIGAVGLVAFCPPGPAKEIGKLEYHAGQVASVMKEEGCFFSSDKYWMQTPNVEDRFYGELSKDGNSLYINEEEFKLKR